MQRSWSFLIRTIRQIRLYSDFLIAHRFHQGNDGIHFGNSHDDRRALVPRVPHTEELRLADALNMPLVGQWSRSRPSGSRSAFCPSRLQQNSFRLQCRDTAATCRTSPVPAATQTANRWLILAHESAMPDSDGNPSLRRAEDALSAGGAKPLCCPLPCPLGSAVLADE